MCSLRPIKFMAYFEMHAHAEYSLPRRRSAILLVDSLIRLLSFASLDAGHTGGYMPFSERGDTTSMLPPALAAPGNNSPCTGCACEQLTLKNQWPPVASIAPRWRMTVMWPSMLSEGEVQKEECRRVVWSTVMMTAFNDNYLADDPDRSDLSIHDRKNVSSLSSPVLARFRCSPLAFNSWRSCFLERRLAPPRAWPRPHGR